MSGVPPSLPKSAPPMEMLKEKEKKHKHKEKSGADAEKKEKKHHHKHTSSSEVPTSSGSAEEDARRLRVEAELRALESQKAVAQAEVNALRESHKRAEAEKAKKEEEEKRKRAEAELRAMQEQKHKAEAEVKALQEEAARRNNEKVQREADERRAAEEAERRRLAAEVAAMERKKTQAQEEIRALEAQKQAALRRQQEEQAAAQAAALAAAQAQARANQQELERLRQQKAAGPFCAECGKAIEDRAIEIAGRVMHPNCFKCTRCNKPTGTTFFQIEGKAHCVTCSQEVAEEHKREAARREADELKRRAEENAQHERAAGEAVKDHFATHEGRVIVAKPAAKDAPKTKFTKGFYAAFSGDQTPSVTDEKITFSSMKTAKGAGAVDNEQPIALMAPDVRPHDAHP